MQNFSKELKELKKKLYLEKYRPHVKPFSGVAERLRELHERKLVLVLASSSDEDEVKYSISLLGIESFLKGYTSKDDAQHSKPSPEIFQAALEESGHASRSDGHGRRYSVRCRGLPPGLPHLRSASLRRLQPRYSREG